MGKSRPHLFVTWGRTKPAACPKCQSILRSVTGLDSTRPIHPAPGCMSLCDQCSTWLVFEPDMTFRIATDAEIAALPREARALAEVIADHVFSSAHHTRRH